MKTGIITNNESTFTLSNLMGSYFFSNPRKAAIAASITLSERGVRHELIQERDGNQFTYLLVDYTGRGVRYLKP